MKSFLSLLVLGLLQIITFSQEKGLDEKINESFKPISDAWGNVVFYPIKISETVLPDNMVGLFVILTIALSVCAKRWLLANNFCTAIL